MVYKLISTILVLLLFLTGCASVQFTSAPQPTVAEVQLKEATAPEVLMPTTSLPSVSTTHAPGTVYEYGRFKVTVLENGSQVILGGVFVPSPVPPQELMGRHTIFINYLTKELTYYRQTPQGISPVVGYAVVTPAAATLPQAIVVGQVTHIDTKPRWCPTPNIRKKYPDLPRGCLPFGHKDNAMGAAKFMIDWQLPKALKASWSTIRLHGASGYPSGSFWGEETFGCTRLEDDALKSLIKDLGPQAVREGIAIVLLKGDTFAGDAL